MARGWLGLRMTEIISLDIAGGNDDNTVDYYYAESFFRILTLIVSLPFLLNNSIYLLIIVMLDFYLTGILTVDQSIGNGRRDIKKAYLPFVFWISSRLAGILIMMVLNQNSFLLVFFVSTALTFLLFYRKQTFLINFSHALGLLKAQKKLFTKLYFEGGINTGFKTGDVFLLTVLGGANLILPYKALKTIRGLIDVLFSRIYSSMIPLKSDKDLNIYKLLLTFFAIISYVLIAYFSIDKMAIFYLFPGQYLAIINIVRFVIFLELMRGILSLFSIKLIREQLYLLKSLAVVLSFLTAIVFYFTQGFNILLLIPMVNLFSVLGFIIIGNIYLEKIVVR